MEKPFAEAKSCTCAGRLGDRRDGGGSSSPGNCGGGRGAGVAGGALLTAGVGGRCITRCTAAPAPGAEAVACRFMAATVMKQALASIIQHAEAAPGGKRMGLAENGSPDDDDMRRRSRCWARSPTSAARSRPRAWRAGAASPTCLRCGSRRSCRPGQRAVHGNESGCAREHPDA